MHEDYDFDSACGELEWLTLRRSIHFGARLSQILTSRDSVYQRLFSLSSRKSQWLFPDKVNCGM